MYLISSGAFHFFAILHWSYVELVGTLWCVQVELAIATRYHRLEGIETLAAALGGSSVTTMGLTACGLDTESFRILRDALTGAVAGGCPAPLRSLSLAHNMGGDEAASVAVKDMLVQNCFDALDFSHTNAVLAERAVRAIVIPLLFLFGARRVFVLGFACNRRSRQWAPGGPMVVLCLKATL